MASLPHRTASASSSTSLKHDDPEKAPSLDNGAAVTTEPAPSTDGIAAATGPFAAVTRYLANLGVETRSTERVPEDARDEISLPRIVKNQIFFWLSVNLSFSTLATGYLGSLYYTLDFRTSMAIIWCGTALGVAVSATMATIGPKTGLRTMAASRFAGGWAGTTFFTLVNALCQMCYAITCAIAGGQALKAINHDLSLTVGIVILSVLVLLLCVWGYQFLHYWERYSWPLWFLIYCILLGLGSKGNYDVHRLTPEMDSGAALRGDVLSFFGIMFSVGSGWTSIAADYNMTLPVSTPTWVVWVSSFIGMYLPIAFTCSLSASLLTISKPEYVAAFEEDSLGGIVGKILIGGSGGFGKFLLVLLAFSTISANVPNFYSGALCLQTVHPVLQKIPRVFFVLVFGAVVLVVAIVGQEHFSEIVSNFAAILAYYTALFSAIVFWEIFYFRYAPLDRKPRPGGPVERASGKPTNWDDVTNYSKLPPGLACWATIACVIPFCVMGMAATWYIGPIALMITKPYGGDLGFEIAAGVSIIFYPLFRHLEVAYFKR
ncbi:hypothetical protein JCM10213v2_003492 [Rhodosporidiobolus nylandii]